MKRTGIHFLTGCSGFLFLILFLQTNIKAQEFRINHKDQTTLISSGDLNISTHLRKPESFPQSSEPGTWKVKKDTTVSASLAGYNGQLNSVTYSTNIGLLTCQTWVSERKELVAFRQVFTNTSGKPVKLKALYPLFIDDKDALSFGNMSDWRILTQYLHKNGLPRTEVPAAGKSFTCDPFFIINNNNGNGKNLLIGFQTFYFHIADIIII